MINRFIFSLRYSNQIFLEWARVGAKFLFLMTLFRVGLFFLVVQSSAPNAGGLGILLSFFAGLRFDLLILGFIFVPVGLCLLVQSYFLMWAQGLLILYKVYFFAVWLAICLLNLVDFLFFLSEKKRMRFDDYQLINWDWIQSRVSAAPNLELFAFTIMTLILLVIGLAIIVNVRWGYWKDRFSPDLGTKTEILWRLVLPLLGVALAARGTVEEKHLNIEHSQVSSEVPVNEMALNPIWCFDK